MTRKTSLIIDFPVEMHDQISKPGHFAHSNHQIRLQHAELAQDRHTIGIVFRASASSLGCQMIADIKGSLCGHDQEILGAIDCVGVGKERLNIVFPKLLKLAARHCGGGRQAPANDPD